MGKMETEVTEVGRLAAMMVSKKNKTAMHSFAVLKNHDTPFHKCQEDRAKKVVLWVKVVAWVRFLEPTW